MRDRYREDVVRVLAYTRGGVIQYRYGMNIVDPAASETLKSIKPGTETVALCFIHLDDTKQEAKLVPLRLGKLKSFERVGSSLVLNIELDDFVAATPGTDLYQAAVSARGNIVPHFGGEAGSRATGSYVFTVDNDALFGGRSSDIVAGFEATVNALTAFPMFKQSEGQDNPSSLFFHVLGLRKLADGFVEYLDFIDSIWPSRVEQREVPFKVTSGGRYELDIYHYYPEVGRPDSSTRKLLQASSPSELIEFISDANLIVDSEYDVKKVVFDVQRSSTSHRSFIDVCVLSSDEKTEHAKLNLPVTLRWNIISVKVQILFITLGVSLPGVIGLISSGHPYGKWAIPIIFISGFVVAIATTFGVKRGI